VSEKTGEPESDEAAAARDAHLAISSKNPHRTESGIGAAFIVATFAGLGLAVTYAVGGQTQIEGGLRCSSSSAWGVWASA